MNNFYFKILSNFWGSLQKTLTPDHWTNGAVEIDLSTDDNLSGVRDITLPDGSVVDAT